MDDQLRDTLIVVLRSLRVLLARPGVLPPVATREPVGQDLDDIIAELEGMTDDQATPDP